MKKSILLIGLFVVLFTSCKTFDVNKRLINVPIQKMDFTVVGFVRVEGKTNNKSTSYDELLKEARRKYNNDKVDIVSIKIDTYKTSTKRIINALVILYVEKKPVK